MLESLNSQKERPLSQYHFMLLLSLKGGRASSSLQMAKVFCLLSRQAVMQSCVQILQQPSDFIHHFSQLLVTHNKFTSLSSFQFSQQQESKQLKVGEGNCLILHSQQAAVEGEGKISVTSPVSVAWFQLVTQSKISKFVQCTSAICSLLWWY